MIELKFTSLNFKPISIIFFGHDYFVNYYDYFIAKKFTIFGKNYVLK